MPSVLIRTLENVTWQQMPSSPYVLDSGLHIWRLSLSSHKSHVKEFVQLLQPDEMQRAEKYHNVKDRERFIISRAMLRNLLSGYLNMAAVDISIHVGNNKKPFIITDNGVIHYNVSHAGDMVVVAISNQSVGIDTEYIATDFDYSEIVTTCFNDTEAEFISSNLGGREHFYLCWTRKEALVKGTGKGIDDDLIGVPCLDGNHTVAPEKIGSKVDWDVISFDAGQGNICSVASPTVPSADFFTYTLLSA